jgi:hypothetical protein
MEDCDLELFALDLHIPPRIIYFQSLNCHNFWTNYLITLKFELDLYFMVQNNSTKFKIRSQVISGNHWGRTEGWSAKRHRNETKRNRMKRNQTKRNETERSETKPIETKRNVTSFHFVSFRSVSFRFVWFRVQFTLTSHKSTTHNSQLTHARRAWRRYFKLVFKYSLYSLN